MYMYMFFEKHLLRIHRIVSHELNSTATVFLHVCHIKRAEVPTIVVLTTRMSNHMKGHLVASKGRKLRNVITNNVIRIKQKTESFVHRWQRAHVSFQVTRFPAFVGASDVISSVLSIR